MLVFWFMKQGLLLAAFLFAKTGWADGYVWFSTREEGKVDAPFWPGYPEFRAGLFEVEVKEGRWEWKALYPQTTFQTPPFRMEYVGWYVHPVTVRVPEKEPGEEVTLVVRWFDGEAIQRLGEGEPVRVRLGTKDQPAVLVGMRGATRTGGYDTFGPWYEDYQFQTVLAKNGVQGKILSVLFQDDGLMVIVGDFTEVNGQRRLGIARVGEKGRLDEAFESPLPQDFKVNSAALDAQGLIALGGEFRFPEGVRHLVRLRSDGRLDDAFEAAVTNEVMALAAQPDGKMVVGTKGERSELLRVEADGKEDKTFQRSVFTKGTESAQIHAIRIANTDTIWVGGDFEARNGIESGSFVQLAEDGTLDLRATPVMIKGPVYAIGSNVVGGAFWEVNGGPCSNAVRITSSNLVCGGGAIYTNQYGASFFQSADRVNFISADGQAAIIQFQIGLPAGGTGISARIAHEMSPAYGHEPTAITWRGTNVYVGMPGQVKRYTTRMSYRNNKLLGLDKYEGFLLLRPARAWGEEFEYSEDLRSGIYTGYKCHGKSEVLQNQAKIRERDASLNLCLPSQLFFLRHWA